MCIMRNEVTERPCRGGIHRAELLGNGCQKVDLLSLHSPFPEMDILNGLFKVSHFFNVSHCLTFGYNIRPGCFERARERLVTNCKQFLPKSLSWISGHAFRIRIESRFGAEEEHGQKLPRRSARFTGPNLTAGQGWGSSFSKGTKFLFWGTFQ